MELDQALVAHAAGAVKGPEAADPAILWNRAAEAMFGHSRVDGMGATLEPNLPGTLRERHWQLHHQTFANGETQYVGRTPAVPAVRADGTRISIELTVAPARDEAGGLAGNEAIMRDVTIRPEEQRALAEAVTEPETELANLRR